MFLVGVPPCDPSIATIIFSLQEEAADPEVLSNACLVVETIFLLSDVDTDSSLFEDCEGAHRDGVICWHLEILAFGSLLWTRLDGLRRVDGAGGD